jgi:hypothetical protein
MKLCKQLLDSLNKNHDVTASPVASNSNIATQKSVTPKPAGPTASSLG